MKYISCNIVFGLLLVACNQQQPTYVEKSNLTFSQAISTTNSKNSTNSTIYSIPNDWIYFSIPNTSFELPLPSNVIIDGKNDAFVRLFDACSTECADINMRAKDYFSRSIKKETAFSNLDEYLASICKGVTEGFDGTKGDYSGYNLEYRELVNGIDVVMFHGNCMNMRAYAVGYNNEVFSINEGGDDWGKGSLLFKISLMNIRPKE